MKTCPYCAEQIQDAATKCRFCGSELPASATPLPPPPVAPPPIPSSPPPLPQVPMAGERPRMARWGWLGITALLLFTCGLGGFYLGYIQYAAVRKLNPKALEPGLAILLEVVGAIFTGGILGLWVTWKQTKCLIEHGDTVNDPRRNTGLMMLMMAGSIVALLSVWAGWTGFTLILAVAFEIYTLAAFHKELELYTDPA